MKNRTIFFDFNPWWEKSDYKLKEENWAERFVFSDILAVLEKPYIISISGLRRLGKTTILKQLIARKLKQKHEAKKIFFYQFSRSKNNLEEVLEFYFKSILNESLQDLKCYVFLDELQYVPNWQDILKHYYDLNPEIHFIITGSASLFLKKDKKESLAGRILDFKIAPQGFSEYLYIKNNLKTLDFPNLTDDNFAENLQIRQNDLLLYQDQFLDYLIYGEFPQIVKENDILLIKKYLEESLLDKFFNQDILLFDIKKHQELKVFYSILMQGSAQFLNKSNVAQEIALSKPILSKYLEVLREAFLIDYSKNFTRSLRSREKSFKKVYSSSLNLLAAVLEISSYKNLLYPDFIGHVIETYVYNRLKLKYGNNLFFYHKNKKEVDLVAIEGSAIIPLEIKTKKVLSKNDFKHLLYFLEKNGLEKGFMVYGGEFSELKIKNKKIFLFPFWIF